MFVSKKVPNSIVWHLFEDKQCYLALFWRQTSKSHETEILMEWHTLVQSQLCLIYNRIAIICRKKTSIHQLVKFFDALYVGYKNDWLWQDCCFIHWWICHPVPLVHFIPVCLFIASDLNPIHPSINILYHKCTSSQPAYLDLPRKSNSFIHPLLF